MSVYLCLTEWMEGAKFRMKDLEFVLRYLEF